MKTGKYISLGEYNNIKIGYGTVDFRNLKTIYIKFNSWLSPKKDSEDFKRIIFSSQKTIKQIIMNLNDTNFKPQSIVDLDIRTNGIKLEKRSFMNLEITLFVENRIDIKSKETRQNIFNLSKRIIDSGLLNKSLFNFNRTKK